MYYCKSFLLLTLLAVMPLGIWAYEKEEISQNVGSSITLKAPNTPDSGYPSLHPNTSWVLGGPIRKISGGLSSVAIEVTGPGTATVFCSAWYWDSNVMDHSEKGYRHVIKEWIIQCEGSSPEPGPNPNPNPPIEIDQTNTFLLYDVITRSVNGVDMKFQVTGLTTGSAQVSGSFSNPSVSKNTSGHVSIPEIVPNTSGYKIANFDNNGSLYYSPVPNGLKVTEIQRCAFHECDKLTSIEIPASVKSIFSMAFFGCSLEEVTVLSPTPPELDVAAFENSVSFNSTILNVPKGSKEAYAKSDWGDWFQYALIREIVDPATLRDGDTFDSFTKGGDYNMTFQLLKFQVISAAEKTCRVGWYDPSWDIYQPGIYEYDENHTYFPMAEAITIPSSVYGFTVTEIGAQAFAGYKKIKSVSIPNTVRTIGDYAFSGCSLTSVDIPNSVTSIGEDAFANTKLTSISIPNSVESIGNWAFHNTGITSLYIFDLSAWLKMSLGYNIFDEDNKVRLFLNNKELKDLVIPGSISEIKDNAFWNFSSIASVTIPNSVKSIGYHAFSGCVELKEIRSEIKVPFDFGNFVFDSKTFTNATLYVPSGTKSKYQATAGWKKFKNIVEEGGQPIIKGDLNGDMKVSITDVVLIIDVIAGLITDESKVASADVNSDGKVSISDCVAAIDLIAAQQSNGARMATNGKSSLFGMPSLITEYNFISASVQDDNLTVTLDNDDVFTAFQMVISMPAGMTLVKATMDGGRGPNHKIVVNNLGNGQYLLAGFSIDNDELAGKNGHLFTVATEGKTVGDIVINEVEFATAEAETYHLDGITISGTSTGISDAIRLNNNEEKINSIQDELYDLQGRRMKAIPNKRGMYIHNRKKVYIK